MATHPDLDQLLTPREREVLDLLRLGLTNAEIGERLDISADGAKYHVSEIIGKLGVRNRREAAYWPERPPWWAAAVSPLASFWRGVRRMLPGKAAPVALAASITLVVALLAGLGVIAFLLLRADSEADGLPAVAASCPTREQPRFDPNERDLTLQEIQARVSQARTCTGYALHVRMAGDTDSGPYSQHNETELWTDEIGGRSRAETTGRFISEEVLDEASESGEIVPEYRIVALTVGDALYTRQETDPPDTDSDPIRVNKQRALCPDLAAAAISTVCNNPLAELESYVEWDQTYRGNAALAMTQSGTSRGSDETYETTTRSYFDPETYLPLGTTQEGTLDVGTIHPVSSDIPVAYDFVRLDTLPEDFFDPIALGYVEEDPEEPLLAGDVGGPVYWLGRQFGATADFPTLALDRVAPVPDRVPEPFTAQIYYRSAADEFGPPLVTITLYTPEDWQAFVAQSRGGNWWDGECVERAEVTIGGRAATVFARPDDSAPPSTPGTCPPATHHAARIDLGDAIVDVDAPSACGRTCTASPYDSREGMELLIRSLRRRE
ncbi:MAG: helix-turn-helix transcriptional regulator [Dehalococcoidia bacterium]